MRTTCKCPKCKHHNVLYLPVVPAAQGHLMAYVTPSGIKDVGFVAYVCEKCGYSELYVKEPAQIIITNVPGGRLIRGVPEWEEDRISMRKLPTSGE